MKHPVFFLRHGETLNNIENRLQGSAIDSPLTDRGTRQAHSMAVFLQNKGIVSIHSSPQGRAMATAKIVADALRLPIDICPFFHEMDFGLLTGMIRMDAEKRFDTFLKEYRRDKAHTNYPDGESFADIDVRIRPGLLAIITAAKGPVAFIGHEGMNRIARAIVMDHPIEEAVFFKQPNTVIVECRATEREIIHHLHP